METRPKIASSCQLSVGILPQENLDNPRAMKWHFLHSQTTLVPKYMSGTQFCRDTSWLPERVCLTLGWSMFNMYPFAFYMEPCSVSEKGPCSVGLMTLWIFCLNDNLSELSSQKLTFEFCVLLTINTCIQCSAFLKFIHPCSLTTILQNNYCQEQYKLVKYPHPG
jgi:hypothetical protein